MKQKKLTALFLALLMVLSVFGNASAVFAQGEEESKTEKQVATREENAPEVSDERVAEPVKAPGEKTFTVTKRAMGSNEEGELVGEYDTFHDAIGNCKQEDLTNQYIVTMNRDYEIPDDEPMWGKSKVNMLLRSKDGEQFTLSRSNKNLISLYNDTILEINHVILDGMNNGQAIGVTGGTLTLGQGAVVQNFTEYPDFDGPAIIVSSNGTLNILEGATIQNNASNIQGGAIQAYNGTTMNISGGTFKKNKSNTSDGGFLAAYGTLNVTGGTFENNEAKKTGGAIIIGSRATASIENAIFRGNKASTSGAVYSGSETTISNTSFENNNANWGGAIFASKAMDLNKVIFTGNRAAKQGGSLYISSGDSSIKDCTFAENKSENQGGAVYIKAGNTTISGSNFTNNHAAPGGGIFIAHDSKGTTTIEKSSFKENTSDAFGGGIYLGRNSKLEVKKSAFEKNEAAFGAGISSSGIVELDTTLTGIKVEDSSFTENEALMGAGMFTAFPTEVLKSTFTRNAARVHPQDDQTNPHTSGVGGAMEIIDHTTVIKGSVFEDNWAYGSGGAIGINGVSRDEEKDVTSLKENLKVEISENTQFIGNTCLKGQGGAIFTIPYLYDIEGYKTAVELKDKAYQNLSTSADTVFKGNVAIDGFVNPPSDYAKYSNLQFSRNSFTDALAGQDVAKSLLNNYDVNYKNKTVSAYFDPNGGAFTDPENKKPRDTKVIATEKDKEITILPAPKREGYKFLGWKGTRYIPEDKLKEFDKKIQDELNKTERMYQPGEKLKLESNFIFIAQWEKTEKPAPKPEDKVYKGGTLIQPADTVLNKEDHAQYMIGYENGTFKPENKMTREEVAVMFSRLLKNPPTKGRVYGLNFSDVDGSRWSVTAISYMSDLGILKGYPDGNFKPEAPITRAEFAAMAARFADLKGGEKTFTDLAPTHWAYDVVRKAAGAGWIEGYPDGSFKPDKSITRAEVVSITNRMLNRKADATFVDSHLAELLTFTDLNKSHWAYYPIMEATNGHTYLRDDHKIDEVWKKVTSHSFVYDK